MERVRSEVIRETSRHDINHSAGQEEKLSEQPEVFEAEVVGTGREDINKAEGKDKTI